MVYELTVGWTVEWTVDGNKKKLKWKVDKNWKIKIINCLFFFSPIIKYIYKNLFKKRGGTVRKGQ